MNPTSTVVMAYPRWSPACRRWLSALLAVLIGFGPLLTPAYAAGLIPLANEPIGIQNSAPPNIVLTIDDSSSMLSDWLPEAVAADDFTPNPHCRGGLGAMGSVCGSIGGANDYTAFAGATNKYFSPGWTAQQFNYPYSKYTGTYDASGPGAGCFPGNPPTCYHGVDPVNLPGGLTRPGGIGNFPIADPNDATSPPVGWPLAGQPYPYWQLWPAPAHNAAVNTLYYNPELTYAPPVDSTGASFPTMNAANTGTWTQVPGDPWASTIVYVDLTASITVGLWCNSDWSMGGQNDPTQCRRNGTAAAAVGSGKAVDGQDYTYPWAPPGFTLSASVGDTFVANGANPYARATSTTLTYAAQKVSLDPTTLNAVPVASNSNLYTTALWATSTGATAVQDGKYFYENENILWCDPTNAAWPASNTHQTCQNITNPSPCNGVQTQVCNLQTQTCSAQPQTCNGAQVQTCNGAVTQTCNGAQAQTCNQTQTCVGVTGGVCNGAVAQTCTGLTAQTCNGAQTQTCNNVQNQTCNLQAQVCNGSAQVCNLATQTCSGPFTQVCNLPGTQTCQPPVCTTTYTPPGCNLLPPDPENPCTGNTTCAPPVCTPNPGHCSIQTSTSCTSNANCPTLPGTCSINAASCMSNAACTPVGTCSIDHASCATSADCSIANGHCSIQTATSCTSNANCPQAGHCSIQNGTVCTSNANCPTISGTCSIQTATACTSNANCPTVPGHCSIQNATACTTAANCPNVGHCSTQTATQCTTNANCPTIPGLCNTPPGTTACTTNGNCPAFGGHCSVQTATACTTAANCPGTCSIQTATACTSNAQCPTIAGHCSTQTGTACTTNANCPTISGHCSIQTGTACTTNANCPTISGHCSIQTGTACTTNANCPTVAGHCNIQTGTACTTAANCPSAGYCSVQTATVCTSNAGCPTISGTCQRGGAACTSNANCPLTGTCSITNTLVCTSNNDCPLFALPASAVTCSTGGVGGVATADLRQDAENNGVVCRRNNKAYAAVGSVPAVAAGRYNYPNNYGTPGNNYTTPVTGGTGADACTATPHFVSVPRHYWNTSVEWCDTQIGLVGDKWLGYGTDVNGTCQAGYDSTHLYPRFYQFGASGYVDNYANAAFQRVDLDITQRATASYTTTWTDASGQQQTITRTFDQEMTNYANWFAYYRTRVQAVKTVTSLVFNQLDDTYNVGFHTLSNGLTTATAQSDPATFVNVAPFNAAQKAAWFQQLFAISIPLRLETPTLDAMVRIGNYFLTGTSSVLPGATDPITLSCQKNWHMLFTDGFVNQPGLPATTVGDQDLTVPVYPDYGVNPIPGLVPGSAWPHPYQEDPSNTASNSQSDYAMYYWVTDMRTGAGPTAPNNVPTSSTDPASWQHLNFAALSLGTQGKLPASNPSLTMNQLAAGSRQWPQPYPTVNHPNNSGVDDLWHAAVNGRGQFVNANSAAQLELGMGQILQDITNQAGSRAAAGFVSNSISAGSNSVYEVSFQPGWGGDIIKVPVDPVTGVPGAPIWDAAKQLGSQLLIVNPGDTPWFTNRKIFTVNDAGQAVPLLWGNLSAAQQDTLAPGLPATGQAVLAFLRGSPTNEGISLGQFRVRATVASGEDFLGDIVDSSAVYVGPPNASYLEGNNPGYAAFVASHAARTPMVYVGANDGMLHALNDSTGNEAWAFMPHDLYRAAATGLGALSYQNGALPPFRHHYYVDSTPRVVDVDFGSQNWHSLLVGGLGKGGRTYYALDVTNPAAVTTELTAASQYLWTFTNADMGYSYMRPIVAKTRAFNGAWLVIVTSGYNNPSGVGKIFFINAADGTLLKTMSTGFGDSADPSGFAQIAGYTKDFHNQLVEQLYGGDLYGNFWRFDVSDPNPANWTVALMASLTDPSGVPQPVTTTPNIEVDAVNGIDRWVFVGTGRLLNGTDLTTPSISNQIQTLYAIRDGTGITPLPITSTLQPRVSMVPIIDKIKGVTSLPQFGWYDDLPAGQRIITPPQAAISLVAYAGTSPQTDPCLTGQPATLYVRSFTYGASLLNDAGGNPVAGIAEASGAVGMDIFSFPGSSNSASSGNLDIRIGVTAGTTGNVTFFKVKVNFPFDAHRMSWRQQGQ
jgi:type IV pilus assembly protein PilY1